jgi:corrinoid protein of di/trimethylamine methyltransferase
MGRELPHFSFSNLRIGQFRGKREVILAAFRRQIRFIVSSEGGIKMNKEELLEKLANTIIDGDEQGAAEVAEEILSAGIDPGEAIKQGATKGLDEVGERFQRLEAFLPDLVSAGDTMKACLAVFIPHIRSEQMGDFLLGNVVIGTVRGDVHDIGKNMVANMLTVSGFEVYDLGIDVPVKRFVEKAEEVRAKVIALSALLSQTAHYQQEVIAYLRDVGLREKYYVVVGGAPVSPEWAIKIGADGYAKTAIDAGQLLKRLVAEGVRPPLPQTLVVQ